MVKCLFVLKKYFTTEAAVDNLVWHLFHMLGANDGNLLLVPKMGTSFKIRDQDRDAIADFSLVDVVSTYLRLAVLEQKNYHELIREGRNKLSNKEVRFGEPQVCSILFSNL